MLLLESINLSRWLTDATLRERSIAHELMAAHVVQHVFEATSHARVPLYSGQGDLAAAETPRDALEIGLTLGHQAPEC